MTSVGAVTIFPVNPAIVSQSVTLAPPDEVIPNRMQTAIWTFYEAKLMLDGRPEVDLLFTEDGDLPDCRVIDTPTSAPVAFGKCLDFTVLEALDESAGAQRMLRLSFWVQFKRVIPFVRDLIGHEDDDDVLNGADNCPLVDNPDQADTGGFGIGDACRVVDFFGAVQLDSDADGVADVQDNCVHLANPLQINPPSIDFPDIEAVVSDGIGDKCEPFEQVIDIGRPANPPTLMDPVPLDAITVPITFSFVLPRTQGFIVIDFNDAIVAPDCEWSIGECSSFDPFAITACIKTSGFDAALGCN